MILALPLSKPNGNKITAFQDLRGSDFIWEALNYLFNIILKLFLYILPKRLSFFFEIIIKYICYCDLNMKQISN